MRAPYPACLDGLHYTRGDRKRKGLGHGRKYSMDPGQDSRIDPR